jgi:hypothetical protein
MQGRGVRMREWDNGRMMGMDGEEGKRGMRVALYILYPIIVPWLISSYKQDKQVNALHPSSLKKEALVKGTGFKV